MFGLFKKDPTKELRRAYEAKMREARDAMRNDGAAAAAVLYTEAEAMREQLDAAEADKD